MEWVDIKEIIYLFIKEIAEQRVPKGGMFLQGKNGIREV